MRIDKAAQVAFGLPGCPEQSTLQDTLNAATDNNVTELRGTYETISLRYSPAASRPARGQALWVDIDLSPLPASARAEASERGYMGREWSKRDASY